MEAKRAKLDLSLNIMELPSEMLLKVFSFLPQSDHYAVGLVSTYFQDLIDKTKWGEETPALEITEKNVRNVKEAIAKKNHRFCFKHVKIEKVENIEDLKYILQSIGKQIQDLSMRKTAAFHLLKDNVINLKSLEIDFDDVLENSVNDSSFNLCFFPLLEELSFIDNYGIDSTTNKLLKQLKSPKYTASLKYFKLSCNQEIEVLVMDSLLHHARTLESLQVTCFYSAIENLNQWKIAFSRLNNLKKLYLSGYYTVKMMNVIFSMLPNETSLEHLQLELDENLDFREILAIIVEKFMNSLQYLELNLQYQLTDVDVMKLGKLRKLRVLKLSHCDKITNMGLLAGIAKERNIFIDELHLKDIPNLDDLSLRVIISRLPNLRFLTLNYLDKAITNTSLQSIFRFSTRLRSLSIKSNFDITDENIIWFGNDVYSINRLRLLVKLTLKNCPSLTDQTLIEGLKLPALRSLELRNCPKITLKGIKGLVKSCPLLEYLRIPSTIFIDDNALFIIANGLKHLRQLKITDCDYIYENFRDQIRDVFKSLQGSTTNFTFSPDCKLEFK